MMLDGSPMSGGKHRSKWSESVFKYKVSTITESRVPRDGAMLTLAIDVTCSPNRAWQPFAVRRNSFSRESL
jgi:hypothetical protein